MVKLDPYGRYSSVNHLKSHNKSGNYGGGHIHGLIEKGDHHLSTLVTSRPWLVNTYDISPVTRHTKPWGVEPALASRTFEPHHRRFGPTLGGRRPAGASLTNI